jgi:hypothetical protein
MVHVQDPLLMIVLHALIQQQGTLQKLVKSTLIIADKYLFMLEAMAAHGAVILALIPHQVV